MLTDLIESSTSPLTRAVLMVVAIGLLIVVLNAVGRTVSAWMAGDDDC